ncbi:MAG: sodium:solute symporter family protein [Myxococcota bacterium]
MTRLDFSIVALYLVALLVAGFYYGYRTSSFKDFAVGDRRFGTAALVATMFATYIGGGSTIGLSEKSFKVGMVIVFVLCGGTVYKLIESLIFLRMEKCIKDSVSIGDIMMYFYGKYGKMTIGAATVVTFTVLLGLQVKAVSYLFEYFLGMTSLQGTLLGCGLVVFYSSFGGIRAVIATDILQFGVLGIAIPLLAVWGLKTVGSWEAIEQGVPQGHLNFFPHGEDASKYLSMFALYVFPLMPALALQRLLLAKSAKEAAIAWGTTGLLQAFFYAVVGVIGLLALTMNSSLEPKQAMPWLIQQLTAQGLQGFLVVGLLAVLMSTADSELHLVTVSLVHDVIGPLRAHPLEPKRELRLARILSVVVGCFAMIAALNFHDILEMNLKFLGFWKVIVPVPLIAAIFGFRANGRTFVIAAEAGVISLLLWELWIGPATQVNGFIPTLFIHTVVFFGARMLDPPRAGAEQGGDVIVVPSPAK